MSRCYEDRNDTSPGFIEYGFLGRTQARDSRFNGSVIKLLDVWQAVRIGSILIWYLA